MLCRVPCLHIPINSVTVYAKLSMLLHIYSWKRDDERRLQKSRISGHVYDAVGNRLFYNRVGHVLAVVVNGHEIIEQQRQHWNSTSS